jgi:hypothetical protein
MPNFLSFVISFFVFVVLLPIGSNNIILIFGEEYENKKYGFKLEYPNNWKVNKEIQPTISPDVASFVDECLIVYNYYKTPIVCRQSIILYNLSKISTLDKSLKIKSLISRVVSPSSFKFINNLQYSSRLLVAWGSRIDK